MNFPAHDPQSDCVLITTDPALIPSARLHPHAEHCEAVVASVPRDHAEALFLAASPVVDSTSPTSHPTKT